MKESFPEVTNPRLMPSPESVTTRSSDFFEAQQDEGMSLGVVLSSLRKYWYASLLTSTLMMGAIGYKTFTEKRIYSSEIQISMELKDNGSSVVEKLAGNSGNDTLGGGRTTLIDTTVQVLQSKTMIQKAIDLIRDPKLQIPVDKVANQLKIQSKQNTNILTVAYSDTSPARVVAVLNALSKVYIENSTKEKKARTNNSIEFIESQLPASRARLAKSSQEIEKFRTEYRFVDPATAAESLGKYRQEIVAELNKARSNYYQTQQQYQELKQQLNAIGVPSTNTLSTTSLTQDSAYQELFKQLSDLELKYSQEKVRFSDANPIVLTLKEKRDAVLILLKDRAQQVLKRQVADSELTSNTIGSGNSIAQNLASKQAELEISLVAQTAQNQSLEVVYQQVEAQIAQLPKLHKQYTELQREYNIASQELTAFLQKLQEFKIVNAEQVVPWKLLDPPAFPIFPVSPDVPRQLGLGGFASLLAGVLVAVGLNKLDGRVDNPDTVKSMTGIQILALIPRVNDLEQSSAIRGGTFLQTTKGKSKDYSYWSFVEAIRTLALGIGLTADRENKKIGKIIALTSSLPKEGKSTITFNTANTLAELGYKVLLVDADLHKSSISRLAASSNLFNREDLDSSKGLSDAIVGTSDWRKIIKTSPSSNLDVLFSGKQTISSIVLFNSPPLLRLMDEWRKEYDYILFDTPPIVGISDTRLLGSLVDGIVYVVSLNVAQRQIIDRGIDIVSSLKTPVLGLAINRVENTHSGYNKYYQYYHSASKLYSEQTDPKALTPEKEGVEV